MQVALQPFTYNSRYSCQVLVQLEGSQHIFEKYSDIRFRQNRPVGAELLRADIRTDRHDEEMASV